MRPTYTDLKLTWAIVLGLSAISPAEAQSQVRHAEGRPIEQLSSIDRTRIERMLDEALTEAVAHLPLIEGQTGFDIRTRLVPERRIVIIELGTRAIPTHTGSELEDQQHRIYHVADELLRDVIDVNGAEFRYGGKDILRILPDPAAPARPRSRERTQTATAPKVALAGGHGLYFNYQYNDWRAQRDPSNNMTEDFVTPYFARDLATQLTSRGATVYKARTNETPIHVPSGQQWWRVAARYYLESILPAERGIWNSLPSATHSLREYDEDIRSRPLYANHVGADYAIHLHTDAASPHVRGTRGYYHTGRSTDAELVSSILCRMKQTIQSTSGYETWSIANDPIPMNNKGENRLAAMPSAIIELGFHTNAADAQALQSSTFRNAAVRGIERGISDHHADAPCSDFLITHIPAFSAPVGTPMDMLVHFEDAPRFPVTLRTRVVTCPQPWTCGPTALTYNAQQDSPIKRTFKCTGTPAQTGHFTYVAWLTDASGIKTPELEYSYSCTVGS
ncbi:N-acetylmuramoyl-L-alanine amidase [Luteimonas sp. 3794]|uniref:N-acetylmuramoyl-L-alanine amidase family protein n=1 Tax=Luteimonas sp. 3794 TaxID=2817730 RepID=UPI00285985AB|nr:N-acetylmuramoyl-L-alanine amidase [Luteimonas sp. 3794]MDR6991709.1 N-acetylmuramoyl-L-alanine amidase [Luteimonas sp. 3794]